MLAYIFASKYLHIMVIRRDVFQAIADPTRREIIGLLARGSLNLNSIAENFKVSRQAVSLHVKILEECDLIKIQRNGRERICQAQLHKLEEVDQWTQQFRAFWTDKIQSLKLLVEQDQPTPKKPNK